VELLRHRGGLAPWLVLIPVTCAWPAFASADPPAAPRSEVINPWAPASTHATVRARGWHGPDGSEVIDPWRGCRTNRSRNDDEPFIVDPWRGHTHAVPTAVFPPFDVVDPWSQ